MKPHEAIALVSQLKAAFPRQELGADTLRIYCEALADLGTDEATSAVRRLIGTSKFFPTIAEIRSFVAETRVEAPPAEAAWEEVRRAIHSVGYYRQPSFSHAAVARAVDFIGWETLCHSEEIGVERAHFHRAYESIRERQVTEANVGRLGPKQADPLRLVADLAASKGLPGAS